MRKKMPMLSSNRDSVATVSAMPAENSSPRPILRFRFFSMIMYFSIMTLCFGLQRYGKIAENKSFPCDMAKMFYLCRALVCFKTFKE